MATDLETAKEIVGRIRDVNTSSGQAPVPTSDTIYKDHLGDIVSSVDQMQRLLRALSDSHYLFSIRLVEDDEAHKVQGILGYVVAEMNVLRATQAHANKQLEQLYQQQFYQPKGASSIIRELLPEARQYNNTPMGRALNLAMMLDQYSRSLTIDAFEYTDIWKIKKLEEILSGKQSETTELPVSEGGDADDGAIPMAHLPPPELGTSSGTDAGLDLDDGPTAHEHPDDDLASDAGASGGQRALDEEGEELTGRWGQAVRQYGSNFLLRMHLRKHEFETVSMLIQTRKVRKEEDLKFVRDSLRQLQGRLPFETGLQPYEQAIRDLRRLAERKLRTDA